MRIMGLIETRNLDFKNVLLLSAQEDLCRAASRQASFIPYNIRLAFGLTTHKIEVPFHHTTFTISYRGRKRNNGL